MTFILASSSPRRREILSHIGLDFRVLVADVDEQSDVTDGARLVEQLSERKALAVKQKLTASGAWDEQTVIIAADTVVVDPNGRILGKPTDKTDAARMLRMLSDNTHRVISGVAVIAKDKTAVSHEITEVTFSHLDDAIIDRYIESGEPMDKAGAYGIQDTAALWVSGIKGDYFNVVGLPLHRLERLLNENFGLSLWKN
jgi:septum formation protein